eukprot:2392278-Pleurochrysis_carterae.AAC.1
MPALHVAREAKALLRYRAMERGAACCEVIDEDFLAHLPAINKRGLRKMQVNKEKCHSGEKAAAEE